MLKKKGVALCVCIVFLFFLGTVADESFLALIS